MRLKYSVLTLVPLFWFNVSYGKECGTERICSTSMVTVLGNSQHFDKRKVSMGGYLHVIGKGPDHGYWIGMFPVFDYYSSFKVEIPDGFPQRNWVKDKEFYLFSGIFLNCEQEHCRPKIIPDKSYDNGLSIVIPR